MTFYIKFLPETTERGANAEIRIGKSVEQFCAATNYWSEKEYHRQWLSAIEAVLLGAQKSALISSYSGPTVTPVFAWPLYRMDDLVYIQNHLIFLDKFKRPFEPERVAEFVYEREVVSEDGGRIEEWSIPISSLQEYFTSQ